MRMMRKKSVTPMAKCEAPQSPQAQLYILYFKLEVTKKAGNFILSLSLKTSLLSSSLPLKSCYSDHLLWLRKPQHFPPLLLISPQYLYMICKSWTEKDWLNALLFDHLFAYFNRLLLLFDHYYKEFIVLGCLNNKHIYASLPLHQEHERGKVL